MFLTLMFLTCSVLTPQEGAAKPENPLEKLFAKTDTLEGFTANYKMIDRKGCEGHLMLAYEAPNRAAVSIKFDDGRALLSWIVDGETCIQMSDANSSQFGRFDGRTQLERIGKVYGELRQQFSDAPAGNNPLGPGVLFDWDWNVAKPGEESTIEVGIEFSQIRTHLCGWLRTLARQSVEPRESDTSFVWTDGESEIEISKSTGFVERMTSLDPESKSMMALESLELVEAADDKLFAMPKSASEGASDISSALEATFMDQNLRAARSNIWVRLSKWVNAKDVKWDEHSPLKLTAVFRVLHEQVLETGRDVALQNLEGWIDSTAEKLSARLREIGPDNKRGLAEFAATREKALASISQGIERYFEDYSNGFGSPPSSVPKDFAWTEAFSECERAAMSAEFQSQIREPVLAHFKEKFDEAEAGK